MIATITANPSVDRRYNIKKLEENTVQRTSVYQATAGGKGINVARVINSLDKKVAAMGFLGGNSGDFIYNELKDLNIENNFTKIRENTRTCINIIDENHKSIEILESGPEINKKEKLRFLDNYKNNITNYEIITISGSLPTGIEKEFYKKIIKIAKQYNKMVILDSSGRALKCGIKAKPDIIKPNKNEVEDLVGFSLETEKDYLKAGKNLQSMGAKNIALTLGKEGMYYLTEKEAYKVGIPEVKAVNVTGSGDSVVAGLAIALQQDMDIKRMLKFSNSCGVANAVEKKTGFVILQNVKKYMKEIKVIKI